MDVRNVPLKRDLQFLVEKAVIARPCFFYHSLPTNIYIWQLGVFIEMVCAIMTREENDSSSMRNIGICYYEFLSDVIAYDIKFQQSIVILLPIKSFICDKSWTYLMMLDVLRWL